MTVVAKPNTFSANTTISPSAVNANFDTIYNEFNGSISAANLAAGAVTTAKIAADNITNALIADGAIFPEQLLAGTGTSWAWQDFTPSLANWTIGSGGSAGTTAKYCQIGKTVFVFLKSILGTSGQSVSGEPTFNLPVTASSNYANLDRLGGAWMNAAGTGYSGYVRATSTTTAKIVVMTANTTYVGDGAITSSVPGTWAAGNQFATTFIYQAA